MYLVFGLLLWLGAVPCAFARVTHIPCPGCGSSRAVHAILHGDFLGALRLNPLGPLMAVVLGIYAALSLKAMVTTGEPFVHTRFTRRLNVVVIVLAGLSAVVWVARFFGFLGGPVPV